MRIAEHQRPGLGAQIVEKDVIFGGQAITAKSVECLRDCPRTGIGIPPCGERYGSARRGCAIGNVADCAPDEESAAIDVAQQVRERVRDALELADELVELLAFARISRREFKRFAPDPGKAGGDEQFPFLDARRESGQRLGTR